MTEARLIGEQKLLVAEQNPLMTDAARQSLRRDFTTIERLLGDVAASSDQVASQASSYGTRLTAAATTFEHEVRSIVD